MKRSSNNSSPNEIKLNKSAIFAEQVSQLYTAMYGGLFATLVNSIILAAVMWPVVDRGHVLNWLFAAVFITLLRAVTVYLYNKAPNKDEQALKWFVLFYVGVIFAGLLWTSASIWLFPVSSIAHQVFLAFVVGGMIAGAITSLSAVKLTIYTYIALSLSPLLIRFFNHDVDLSIAMGSMLTLFLIMMIIAAKRMNKNIKQNICLHIESIERERSLEQSEQRYKTILETATDAFFLHDMNGQFVDVNKEACKSLGYSHDELIKLKVFDIEVSQDPELLKELWPKLKRGENIRVDGVHRRKDGSTFPVEVGVGIVYMNNETLMSVLARDVTERQRVDRMKNEFISTVSHELRTPLTSIRGALGLVSGGASGEVSDEAKEILTIASRNSDRLLLLINDILDISKIESGEMTFNFETTEIMPLLEQAVIDNSAYAEQYDIKFEITDKIDTAKVNVDKERILQVMANLLSNAAKFSSAGGVVEVSCAEHADGYRISVTDHGMGIQESFQDKVFDKFTQSDSSDTRQIGGTGLGLNITKLIVEQHGGNISYTSKENSGTTFYVDLNKA